MRRTTTSAMPFRVSAASGFEGESPRGRCRALTSRRRAAITTPSFGGEWRLLEAPQQLDWFAEADKCSDDTPRRRSIGPNSDEALKAPLSRAELTVRIHSPPEVSHANRITNVGRSALHATLTTDRGAASHPVNS